MVTADRLQSNKAILNFLQQYNMHAHVVQNNGNISKLTHKSKHSDWTQWHDGPNL